MPLCTLHLLSLTTPLPTFLAALPAALLPTRALTVARVVRWIVTPTGPLSADPLLTARAGAAWDVLLILPTPDPSLPRSLDEHVSARWTVTFGVPSRLLADYERKNAALLRPGEGAVPELTGALGGGGGGGGAGQVPTTTAKSAQALELSGELLDWIREFAGKEGGVGEGAVSMLNLLAFKGEAAKAEYLKYGAAFAESVGKRRGGVAKIVGTVVEDGGGQGVGVGDAGDGRGGKRVWDEIALAHYPSIWHFAHMLAGDDYQAVNKRHRLGSLKDTFILCTTELCLPGIDAKERTREGGTAAKL